MKTQTNTTEAQQDQDTTEAQQDQDILLVWQRYNTTEAQQDFLNSLNGFSGGENFYKDYLNCFMTDGFKFLCDELKSYWLFTDITSVIMTDNKIKDNESFILCKIKVNQDKTATIYLYRDYNKNDEVFNKKNLLYTQNYGYTDFLLNDFEFFICLNDLNTYTFMLKSEY